MKANELRIGNLILSDGCVVSVIAIGEYLRVITKQGNEITAQIDLVKAIPLTEEWLLKLGFIYDGVYYQLPNRHHVGLKDERFVYRIPGNSIRFIDYVHQLQNLYHALTGEELTLTTN